MAGVKSRGSNVLTESNAVAHIENAGVLLIYPVGNALAPDSLWHRFFPKSEMRWEWDESGDDRVARLWHLRARLAASRRVVYTKWYQGRATVFSRELFTAMLGALRARGDLSRGLSNDATTLLDLLVEDSPQGTKTLRERADMQGKLMEATYQRSLRALWSRLLIVGCGEADEGGFPSLTMGATQTVFEELWDEAAAMDREDCEQVVTEKLASAPQFARQYQRVARALEQTGTPR